MRLSEAIRIGAAQTYHVRSSRWVLDEKGDVAGADTLWSAFFAVWGHDTPIKWGFVLWPALFVDQNMPREPWNFRDAIRAAEDEWGWTREQIADALEWWGL